MTLIPISLMANDIDHLFMCISVIRISFFGEISIQIFCPSLNVILVLLLKCLSIYSPYKSFIRYVICKYLLPVCCLSLNFLQTVLWSTKHFNFDAVQLISFFLLQTVLLFIYKRNHCLPWDLEYFLLFFSFKSFIV